MLKTLHRKTLGDLKHNARQFLAVWLVVVLGTTFYGAMYPSGQNLIRSILRTYDQLAYMDYQVQLPFLFKKEVRAVLDLPFVTAAEARLVIESGLQLDPQHDHLTQLRLISIPDDHPPSVNQLDIPVGRPIQHKKEILLLKRFADRHHLQPGAVLSVWINGQQHELTVAGLVFTPEYLIAGRSREAPFPAISSFGVGWMRYSDLARITALNGRVNDIVLQVPDGYAETHDAQIRQSIQDASGVDEEDIVILSATQSASGGVIDANLEGNIPAVASFSAMFLLGSLAVTGVLLGRLVESERQRIGTLRALGVTRRELVLHYLSFGLLIGVTGGAVGSLLGYFTSFLTMLPFVSTLAGGYLPGFVNTPEIPFILLGFAVIVLGTTLAGAYPAWRESGTSPGIALRPPTPKNPSALSHLPLGFLPLAVRQTLRNLLRVPGRSLGTALGVIAGSIMIFSSMAILNSVDDSFETYYAGGQYDLRLTLGDLRAARRLEADIRRIAGVSAVQAGLIGPVTIKHPGQSDFDTMAFVVDETQPFLQLKTIEGAPAFSSTDGVWIGHNLRRVMNLHVGDTITLKVDDEARQTRVLGVVSQVFGSPVFVSRSLMLDWLPGRVFVANTAFVRLRPGAITQVQDELAGVQGVIAVEDYAQFVTDMRNYVEFWRQNAMLFSAFGILLTLAVILNTVNASLNEQHAELSVMRALGVSQGEIAQVVLMELLIMVVIGALVGIPLGREFGFQMLAPFNTDFYGLLGHIQPVSYVLGSLGMLLTALLAAIPGLRSVGKADLGQVSKSQSF